MASTIEGILGFTIFAAAILSGLADFIFSSIWAKFYFISGLRVFSQDVPVEAHHANTPSSSLLNARLYSFWMGGFIFEELDTNQYGFRRQFFSFAPRPMMHGQVIFDTENNRIIVEGYLDWFMIAFTLMWLVFVPLMWLSEGGGFTMDVLLLWVGVVAFFGLITGLLYLMDYYRLARISKIATELWSRQYLIRT
jgi:hypothetical protein